MTALLPSTTPLRKRPFYTKKRESSVSIRPRLYVNNIQNFSLLACRLLDGAHWSAFPNFQQKPQNLAFFNFGLKIHVHITKIKVNEDSYSKSWFINDFNFFHHFISKFPLNLPQNLTFFGPDFVSQCSPSKFWVRYLQNHVPKHARAQNLAQIGFLVTKTLLRH